MRVELPSENWIELRDRLMAGDLFEVQNAVTFTISEGRQQKVSVGVQNDMRNSLLTSTITGWSFEGNLLPTQARQLQGDGYDASAYLGGILDIDDYLALRDAVEPLFQKVSLNRSPN